jgi:hypothetical protein
MRFRIRPGGACPGFFVHARAGPVASEGFLKVQESIPGVVALVHVLRSRFWYLFMPSREGLDWTGPLHVRQRQHRRDFSIGAIDPHVTIVDFAKFFFGTTSGAISKDGTRLSLRWWRDSCGNGCLEPISIALAGTGPVSVYPLERRKKQKGIAECGRSLPNMRPCPLS